MSRPQSSIRLAAVAVVSIMAVACAQESSGDDFSNERAFPTNFPTAPTDYVAFEFEASNSENPTLNESAPFNGVLAAYDRCDQVELRVGNNNNTVVLSGDPDDTYFNLGNSTYGKLEHRFRVYDEDINDELLDVLLPSPHQNSLESAGMTFLNARLIPVYKGYYNSSYQQNDKISVYYEATYIKGSLIRKTSRTYDFVQCGSSFCAALDGTVSFGLEDCGPHQAIGPLTPG